jgi:carbonic anhydrase/acetyltransferase-like protein (isoleucine patch superfamily)
MIFRYKQYSPATGSGTFIAPGADVIGNVTIGSDSSIWFNVTVRGDVHFIRIGSRTNIQDNSILHVTNGLFPLTIGDGVTIAHGVILHGCTIGDNTLIGMGTTILDNAGIGGDSIVAAGSLVREGKRFPAGVLIAGSPAGVKRALTQAEIEKNRQYAENYVHYKNEYLNPEIFSQISEGDQS